MCLAQFATHYDNARLNLSLGMGFYLTSDFQFAYNWSRQMPKPSQAYAPALIIFEDKNQALEKSNNKLLLETNTDKCETTLKYFKSFEDRSYANLTLIEAKKLQLYDLIFGPIPTNSKNENSIPEGLQQLCLKNREIADSFYNESKNITEVIFLDITEIKP